MKDIIQSKTPSKMKQRCNNYIVIYTHPCSATEEGLALYYSVILLYYMYIILVRWICPTCWCQFSNKCHFHCKSDHLHTHFPCTTNSLKFTVTVFFCRKIYILHFNHVTKSYMTKLYKNWITHCKWYGFDMQKVFWYWFDMFCWTFFYMLYCTVKMISKSCHMMQWCWFDYGLISNWLLCANWECPTLCKTSH